MADTPTGCWLAKQEPADYAWATFVKEGRAAWTGARNFARAKASAYHAAG